MAVRRCVLLGLAVLIFIMMAAPALAQNKPIQLALVTPIQIFPEDTPIGGVRLNLLYGRNVSVTSRS
jgi:transcriptional regulator of nitric oxide reductase